MSSNNPFTEYMCFNHRGDISTVKGGPLKFVDKVTYLGNSVSSTENSINSQLSIGYRSFPSSGCVPTTVWMRHSDTD